MLRGKLRRDPARCRPRPSGLRGPSASARAPAAGVPDVGPAQQHIDLQHAFVGGRVVALRLILPANHCSPIAATVTLA